MAKPSPIQAGLRGRCPECGEGAMFSGLLKLAPRCHACGADFEKADVGDGASVFALFIIGFLAMVVFLLVAVGFNNPPLWVHAIIQIPLIFGGSIAVLRPIKGVLFALQWHHDAQEARLDD